MMGSAQNVMENIPNFDKRKLHFGFALSYNKADFYLTQKANAFEADSLLSLNVVGKPGFNLGIISSYNLNPTLRLRFLPTLSFQERDLQYTFYTQDTTEFWNKTVSSTFLDFPLLIKMRTERIGNFAVYMIAGGRFGLDMQSNNKVRNSASSPQTQVVKITKPDYGLELGGGFDFFLQYFKFGIELKMGLGLKDVLIQENLQFSNPIESIRSQMWTLSFTFEG